MFESHQVVSTATVSDKKNITIIKPISNDVPPRNSSEPNGTYIAICRAWTDPTNSEISVAVSDTDPQAYDNSNVKIQYSSLTVGQAQQGIRTHVTNMDKAVDAAGKGKTFVDGIASLLKDGSQIEPLV
jgi:hypothetical protein